MHNILNTIKAPQILSQLNFDLVWIQPPDGPPLQFWRSTCQVLKKEYLQRPVWYFKASAPSGHIIFDTILAVQDIEQPFDYSWEVRIKGRIEPLSVGEIVDLVGIYHKKQRRPGIPSIVVSVYRHAWYWWPTAEVIREDNPRFRAYDISGEWGYAREGENSDHNWLGTSQPEEQARARERFITLATAIANDRYAQPAKPAAAPPPDDDLNLPPE